MDGYAVTTKSLRGASPSHPVTLAVVGSVGPGEPSRLRVGRGEAVRVVTGAGVPLGADAVVPVESVTVGEQSIAIGFVPETGSHIYGVGESLRKGALLLSEGCAMRAQDMGLLIGLGRRRIRVYRRPRVSIVPTGSELTSASRPKAGKVPESHSHVFQRFCELLGCDAFVLGVVGDEPRRLERAIRSALSESDLVLTLGGTSAGKYDHVVDVVSGMRPEVIIHGLKLDRGRVTGVASVSGKPLLMMPGPIQAASNAFFILGTPLIDSIAGRKRGQIEIPCTLTDGWAARMKFGGFLKVVYVRLRAGNVMEAQPMSGETESIRILTDSDGYFVAPESVTRLEKGSTVRVRLLPGPLGL